MGPGPVPNQGSDSSESCHQPHTLIIILDIIIITIIFGNHLSLISLSFLFCVHSHIEQFMENSAFHGLRNQVERSDLSKSGTIDKC